MPDPKPQPKKSQRPSADRDGSEHDRAPPEHKDVEAEVPSSPAKDPIAEPTPVDRARSPRPVVEAEPD